MRLSLFALLALAIATTGCPGGKDVDKTPPVFQNLGVEFAAWNGTAGTMAGSFHFDAANPDAPFTAFGDVIGEKTWVNIEFKPALGADILAPMDGVVDRMEEQEDPDEGYELHLKSSGDSGYLVVLDHIRTPAVSEGDEVVAGQILGVPGAWGTHAGQFEIQVNDDVHGEYTCPLAFLDAAVLASTESALTQLMTDWETFKADPSIFDEASMTVPGCLAGAIDQ